MIDPTPPAPPITNRLEGASFVGTCSRSNNISHAVKETRGNEAAASGLTLTATEHAAEQIAQSACGLTSTLGLGAPASGSTGFWPQHSSYEAYRDNISVRAYDGTAGDIAALQSAGIADADIVRLAELNAFLAYQIRVVAGLRLIGGAS